MPAQARRQSARLAKQVKDSASQADPASSNNIVTEMKPTLKGKKAASAAKKSTMKKNVTTPPKRNNGKGKENAPITPTNIANQPNPFMDGQSSVPTGDGTRFAPFPQPNWTPNKHGWTVGDLMSTPQLTFDQVVSGPPPSAGAKSARKSAYEAPTLEFESGRADNIESAKINDPFVEENTNDDFTEEEKAKWEAKFASWKATGQIASTFLEPVVPAAPVQAAVDAFKTNYLDKLEATRAVEGLVDAVCRDTGATKRKTYDGADERADLITPLPKKKKILVDDRFPTTPIARDENPAPAAAKSVTESATRGDDSPSSEAGSRKTIAQLTRETKFRVPDYIDPHTEEGGTREKGRCPTCKQIYYKQGWNAHVTNSRCFPEWLAQRDAWNANNGRIKALQALNEEKARLEVERAQKGAEKKEKEKVRCREAKRAARKRELERKAAAEAEYEAAGQEIEATGKENEAAGKQNETENMGEEEGMFVTQEDEGENNEQDAEGEEDTWGTQGYDKGQE